jgi:conjugal transfer/entry exclusion protein
VAAAVVLAAGCGGGGSSSDTMPAQDWANSLCGSVDTWAKSIRSAASSLQSGNVSKESLQSTATNVKDATNTLADDLKGLKKPDIQAADKAQQQINTLSSKYKSEIQSLQNDLKNASGATGVVTAVRKTTQTLVTLGSQLQSTFGELQKLDAKGELNKAFRDAPNCKKLQKQGA